MAYITSEYCSWCERDTQHCNSKCVNCAERERRLRIATWQCLTVDERLDDLRRRVEELERSGRVVY